PETAWPWKSRQFTPGTVAASIVFPSGAWTRTETISSSPFPFSSVRVADVPGPGSAEPRRETGLVDAPAAAEGAAATTKVARSVNTRGRTSWPRALPMRTFLLLIEAVSRLTEALDRPG